MKAVLATILILSLTGLLLGCQVENKISQDDPVEVLHKYFSSLSHDDFSTTVKLYGGSYELLTGYNPNVNENDYKKLMNNYMTVNGGQVVSIDKILKKQEIEPGKLYQYEITFLDMNGSSFRENKSYIYTVKRENGKYRVMELPPYLS